MALLAAAVVGGGAVAAEVRCVVDGCVSCLIIIIKYGRVGVVPMVSTASVPFRWRECC